MLIESGELLDEGACVTALANDSRNGAVLGLYSFGAVSLASESRFAFSAHIDKLWCELEDGFQLSDTNGSPNIEWFNVAADYTGPSEGGLATDDTTLFRCVLSNAGKEEGTTEAHFVVDSVSPVCWQRDSYYYRVHGAASFECVGQVGGLGSALRAQIEVSF